MSDLNKLLVHVPSSLCDDFRAKYIVDGANRDKSYDSKVVFLEDTKEIFTKGKIYGSNIEDFKALKKLVGTIPKGATSTNIVDYINEKINNANHIYSVSTKSGENLIVVDTKDKAVTVSSTGDLKTAVNNANNALQRVTVLNKTLEKNDDYLSVDDAAKELATYFDTAGTASTIKTEIIGRNGDNHEVFIGDFFDNPSYTIWAVKNYADYVGANIIGSPVIDTYNSYTIFGSRKYADYVGENIEKNIPEIYGGTGINVVSAIVDGKKHYRISTSAKVFYYKGNKPELINLPSTGNTIGDVWSVGPAKSKGSTLYAWDGDEWINLGSASGVSGVNTTVSSYGIGLTNSYGIVGLKVTSGLVDSKSSYFVKGSTVYTAIESAKNSCNTNAASTVKSSIDALGGDKSSVNGTYVNVQVITSKGEVSGVTVKEETPLTEAIDKANSALQTVTILDKKLSKTSNKLDTSYAANTLKSYFDTYNFYDKYGTAQGLINNLHGSKTAYGSYIDVGVTTYKGEVSYVFVHEHDNLSTYLSYANSAIQHVGINYPGSQYLTYLMTDNDRAVIFNFDVEEVLNYIVTNIDFDKLSTTFKNKMLSYVVSNWVGYTGEVGILRD